jgi:hypothetical protein
MYLVREHTAWSLTRIGRLFGGFHHTTVIARAADGREGEGRQPEIVRGNGPDSGRCAVAAERKASVAEGGMTSSDPAVQRALASGSCAPKIYREGFFCHLISDLLPVQEVRRSLHLPASRAALQVQAKGGQMRARHNTKHEVAYCPKNTRAARCRP